MLVPHSWVGLFWFDLVFLSRRVYFSKSSCVCTYMQMHVFQDRAGLCPQSSERFLAGYTCHVSAYVQRTSVFSLKCEGETSFKPLTTTLQPCQKYDRQLLEIYLVLVPIVLELVSIENNLHSSPMLVASHSALPMFPVITRVLFYRNLFL